MHISWNYRVLFGRQNQLGVAIFMEAHWLMYVADHPNDKEMSRGYFAYLTWGI